MVVGMKKLSIWDSYSPAVHTHRMQSNLGIMAHLSLLRQRLQLQCDIHKSQITYSTYKSIVFTSK